MIECGLVLLACVALQVVAAVSAVDELPDTDGFGIAIEVCDSLRVQPRPTPNADVSGVGVQQLEWRARSPVALAVLEAAHTQSLPIALPDEQSTPCFVAMKTEWTEIDSYEGRLVEPVRVQRVFTNRVICKYHKSH